MGKGTIQSHIGEGKYSVKLLLHRERVDQRIQELTDAINQVDLVELAAAETALTDAQAALDQAIADQDAAIATRDLEKMAAAAKTVAEKAAERDKAKVERDRIKLRLASLKKEKTYLEANTPVDPVVEAWCADLTEDLTGEVATVEIPGERNGVPALIRPGDTSAHPDGAAYDGTRDGQLQPSIAGTPAAVFYNWALLPGWQRWKPTYRIGTIVSLSGDTCALTLDAANSSAQSLTVNQVESLINVPITYMTCNGGAFQIGDRVVVEFENQSWDNPRVIGFESNPRACGGGLVCDPVATGASAGRLILDYSAGGWSKRAGNVLVGNVDWVGFYKDGKPTRAVSWYGYAARHISGHTARQNYLGFTIASDSHPFERVICLNGREYGTPNRVMGAALTKVGGVEYVVAVMITGFSISTGQERLYRIPLAEIETGTWEQLAEIEGPAGTDTLGNSWFFNGEGTEAVNTRFFSISLGAYLGAVKIAVPAAPVGTLTATIVESPTGSASNPPEAPIAAADLSGTTALEAAQTPRETYGTPDQGGPCIPYNYDASSSEGTITPPFNTAVTEIIAADYRDGTLVTARVATEVSGNKLSRVDKTQHGEGGAWSDGPIGNWGHCNGSTEVYNTVQTHTHQEESTETLTVGGLVLELSHFEGSVNYTQTNQTMSVSGPESYPPADGWLDGWHTTREESESGAALINQTFSFLLYLDPRYDAAVRRESRYESAGPLTRTELSIVGGGILPTTYYYYAGTPTLGYRYLIGAATVDDLGTVDAVTTTPGEFSGALNKTGFTIAYPFIQTAPSELNFQALAVAKAAALHRQGQGRLAVTIYHPESSVDPPYFSYSGTRYINYLDGGDPQDVTGIEGEDFRLQPIGVM